MSEQQRAEAEAAALAAQQQAENLEHAQLRAQLEEATLPLMLDAMWAANVLDIESTLRHVCKKVWQHTTVYAVNRLLVILLLRLLQCSRLHLGSGIHAQTGTKHFLLV